MIKAFSDYTEGLFVFINYFSEKEGFLINCKVYIK
jgi:hypothetical protein